MKCAGSLIVAALAATELFLQLPYLHVPLVPTLCIIARVWDADQSPSPIQGLVKYVPDTAAFGAPDVALSAVYLCQQESSTSQ